MMHVAPQVTGPLPLGIVTPGGSLAEEEYYGSGYSTLPDLAQLNASYLDFYTLEQLPDRAISDVVQSGAVQFGLSLAGLQVVYMVRFDQQGYITIPNEVTVGGAYSFTPPFAGATRSVWHNWVQIFTGPLQASPQAVQSMAPDETAHVAALALPVWDAVAWAIVIFAVVFGVVAIGEFRDGKLTLNDLKNFAQGVNPIPRPGEFTPAFLILGAGGIMAGIAAIMAVRNGQQAPSQPPPPSFAVQGPGGVGVSVGAAYPPALPGPTTRRR